jgi:hypothetical protein
MMRGLFVFRWTASLCERLTELERKVEEKFK